MTPFAKIYNVIKTRIPAVLTCAVLSILFAASANAQRYQVGDIVEDFSLVNRATGEPMSLSDLEGNIIFLEWFAYWCPFCQAAAEDIKNGIVDHYTSTEGNPNGVPVLHVGINLQGNAESLSQEFIDRYGIKLVLNDFDRTVASRFQPSNQPIFAIINGVDNSPSHEQWELLYTRLGYGDLSQPIPTFRQVIDSVAAPAAVEAPEITAAPQSVRTVSGSMASFQVTASGDSLSYQWYKDGAAISGATSATFEIATTQTDDEGTYSVTVSNEGGSVESAPVSLAVVLSASDYLLGFNLPAGQMDLAADPDGDGASNLFEYLAQTDPADKAVYPLVQLAAQPVAGQVRFALSFPLHEDAAGFVVRAVASPDPSFAEISESIELVGDGEASIVFEASAENSALFTRIEASPES